MDVECRSLGEDVTTVVSVLHGNAHFSVLKITLEDNKLEIYDGLTYPLKTWHAHAVNILKRCRLVPLDAKCRWKKVPGKDGSHFSLQLGETTWDLVRGEQFFGQNDSYNCGPIACLKLMDLYAWLPATKITAESIRPFILDTFENMLESMREEIFVKTPVELITINDDGADDAPQCMVCYLPVSDNFPGETMPCCGVNAITSFAWKPGLLFTALASFVESR